MNNLKRKNSVALRYKILFNIHMGGQREWRAAAIDMGFIAYEISKVISRMMSTKDYYVTYLNTMNEKEHLFGTEV